MGFWRREIHPLQCQAIELRDFSALQIELLCGYVAERWSVGPDGTLHQPRTYYNLLSGAAQNRSRIVSRPSPRVMRPNED